MDKHQSTRVSFVSKSATDQWPSQIIRRPDEQEGESTQSSFFVSSQSLPIHYGGLQSSSTTQLRKTNQQQRMQASSYSSNRDKTSCEKRSEKSNKDMESQKTGRPKRNNVALVVIIGTCILLALAIGIYALVLTTLSRTTNTTITTTTTTLSFCWRSTGMTVAGIGGVSGTAATQLSSPYDVTLDSYNALYIADTGNNRIQKYPANSWIASTKAGSASGTSGSTSADLFAPINAFVASSGDIFVVDLFNQRIQVWLDGASSGATVAGTGILGTSNNQLQNPYRVVYDANSNTIFIADSTNARIMSYTQGSLTGTVVAGGNGVGTNNTQLSSPFGLYFDSSSNSLVIANTGANNIVRWPLGANSWTLVAGSISGLSGGSSTLLTNPTDVTLDPFGNVYVVDKGNHRIQFFFANQLSGKTIAGVTGTQGSNSTLLDSPYGMTIDSQLNLYVADTNNHRIQKFLRY